MSIEQKIAQILAESPYQGQGQPVSQGNKGKFYRVPEDTKHLDDVLEHDDWNVNPDDIHHDVAPHSEKPVTFIYDRHQDVPQEDEESYLDDTDNRPPSEIFVHGDTQLSPEVERQLEAMHQQAEKENVNEENSQFERVRKTSKKKTLNNSYEANMDSLNLILNDATLSEEFKEKATTIFEAAVIDRVKQEVESLEEAYQERLETKVESIVEGLVEKVDGYLDYVVEQWIEQNEIALERGMKSEILESFVGGLKSLFEDHNIELPDEKFDVVADLSEQVEELQSKLNEQLAENVQMKANLKEAKLATDVSTVITNLSEGLVATDKEKFCNLVADMEYDSFETFEKKAQIIRESYFTNKAATSRVAKSIVTDSPVTLTEDNGFVAPEMRAYTAFLNNQTK